MKITLLIPTMNRPDFLIRQLHYYSALGFPGCICIGDSSKSEHVELTKKAIKALQGKLNIIYREYPNVNDSKCLQQLADLAPTPYVVYEADDDFLVPTALEQCTQFLDSHTDYNAAHGVGVGINLKSSGAYGQVAWASHYEQPVIGKEKASERLLAHLSKYTVTLFSVHRAESWREMYRDISLLTDKSFTELQPCCLSVIRGKVKELDCFYMVRQGHDQRYLLPGIPDWIASPNWLPSYRVFRNCLANALSRQEGISQDKAQEVVEQAFWSYLADALGKQVGKPASNPSNLSRLKEVVGMIPGARQVWHALRSISLRRRNQESLLATLLSPSSSYHADFMPIYRALTIAKTEFPEEKREQ